MRIKLLFPYIILLIIYSCNSSKDLDAMTEGFRTCAQPIVTWRTGLQKDPSTLSNGNAIKLEVDSCLDTYLVLYKKHSEDSEFIQALKDNIAIECPPVSGSVNPMLQMLSEK